MVAKEEREREEEEAEAEEEDDNDEASEGRGTDFWLGKIIAEIKQVLCLVPESHFLPRPLSNIILYFSPVPICRYHCSCTLFAVVPSLEYFHLYVLNIPLPFLFHANFSPFSPSHLYIFLPKCHRALFSLSGALNVFFRNKYRALVYVLITGIS